MGNNFWASDEELEAAGLTPVVDADAPDDFWASNDDLEAAGVEPIADAAVDERSDFVPVGRGDAVVETIDGKPAAESRNYLKLGAANPFNVLDAAARNDTLRGLAGGDDVSAEQVSALIEQDREAGGGEYAVGQTAAELLATAAVPGGAGAGAGRVTAQAAGEGALSELNKRGWDAENVDEAAKAAALSGVTAGGLKLAGGAAAGGAKALARKAGRTRPLPSLIPDAPNSLDTMAARQWLNRAAGDIPGHVRTAARVPGEMGAREAADVARRAALNSMRPASSTAGTAARNFMEDSPIHDQVVESNLFSASPASAQYSDVLEEQQLSPVDDVEPEMRGAMLDAVDSPAMEAYPGLQAKLSGMLQGWLTDQPPTDMEIALMAYKLSNVPGLDWSALVPESEE